MRLRAILYVLIILIIGSSVNADPFVERGYLDNNPIIEMPMLGCVGLKTNDWFYWISNEYDIPHQYWGNNVILYGNIEQSTNIYCIMQHSSCCVTVDSVKLITNPPNNVPTSNTTTVILLAFVMVGVGIAAYKWHR